MCTLCFSSFYMYSYVKKKKKKKPARFKSIVTYFRHGSQRRKHGGKGRDAARRCALNARVRKNKHAIGEPLFAGKLNAILVALKAAKSENSLAQHLSNTRGPPCTPFLMLFSRRSPGAPEAVAPSFSQSSYVLSFRSVPAVCSTLSAAMKRALKNAYLHG